MRKHLSLQSANRHLAMLGITVLFTCLLLALFFSSSQYFPWPQILSNNSYSSSQYVVGILISITASSVATIPTYWGSKKLFPLLAPKVWKSFKAALFALPILNWFAPNHSSNRRKNYNFHVQLENERMSATTRIHTSHSPGLSAANMAFQPGNDDFLLSLICKLLIFFVYLFAFMALHLGYIALLIGIQIFLLYVMNISAVFTLTLCIIGTILAFFTYLLHPILCYCLSQKS